MTRGDEHRVADILDAAQKLAERLGISFETWVADEDLRLSPNASSRSWAKPPGP